MATSNVDNVTDIEVKFFTKQRQYAVPDYKIKIPASSTITELNNLIKKLLHQGGSSESTVSFDFLINGEFLRQSLEEHISVANLSTEELLEIEYVITSPAPEPGQALQHDDWVSAVSSNHKYILTGSYDNAVRIWNTNGDLLVTIPAHTAPVKCVKWITKDDQGAGTWRFISGGHDELGYIWEWSQAKNSIDCLRVCRGHARSMDTLDVSPDQTMFATGSWDQYLKIWSTDLSESDELDEEDTSGPRKKMKTAEKKVPIKVPIVTLSGHTEAVSSVKWMDDRTVCTGSWDHSIKLWDIKSAQLSSTISATKVFFSVDYSTLNNLLVAGCADQYVRLFDPRCTGGDSIVKTTYTSHTGWVVDVAWSPSNEQQFITASYDKILKLWDKRSPRAPLYDIIDHEDRLLCCDWSTPEYILSGGVDNQLRMYRAATHSS